jgi:hypothetical protein
LESGGLMSQKENFYESENKEDRKKNSKYDIGELIVKQYRTIKGSLLEREYGRFFIFDKRKRRDKNGEYWVYDVFYPNSNHVDTDYRLIDQPTVCFIKVA